MTQSSSFSIGKIVKSNTHIDYVCQVFNWGETPTPPQATDYCFGSFVSIQLDNGIKQRLVGVVYNTLLVNPDFGNLGPRLSPRQELEVFSPDYLAETATLVGILALGWEAEDGSFRQGVPVLAATVNNSVACLTLEEFLRFHQEQNGFVRMRYASLLLGMNNPLVSQLLLHIVDRLTPIFPDQQRQLAVMRNTLAWKSIVQPVG